MSIRIYIFYLLFLNCIFVLDWIVRRVMSSVIWIWYGVLYVATQSFAQSVRGNIFMYIIVVTIWARYKHIFNIIANVLLFICIVYGLNVLSE